MEQSLAETLKGADRDVLQEILREAESRLGAQLTAAIAADTRAMTFLGFICAVAAATVGAALAAHQNDIRSLAYIGAATGFGFIVSALYAFEAARPIDFEFVGNDPSSWGADVKSGKSLYDALAEQVSFYDEMIKANRKAMAESAANLQQASKVMILTLCVGGVLLLFRFAHQF